MAKENFDSVSKDVRDIKKEVAESGDDVDDIKEYVDEIRKEVVDSGDDVDEIKEDVDEIKDDVELIKKEVIDSGDDVDEIKKEVRNLSKQMENVGVMGKIKKAMPSKFAFKDIAQQIVGAVIVSSPFAVTEEVWGLAQNIHVARIVALIGITITFDVLLYYFTKYQKTDTKWVGFIPVRILSILTVTYVTSAVMLTVFGVLGNEITDVAWALRLIVLVGLFANIGAGTADLIR